jgi:galactonate dehydratase
MSAKLKARTWYDLHAAVRAVLEKVPPQFKLDFDFNGTLDNAANAVDFLKSLEQYPQVAMIETPIPHGDVAGNRHIRERLNRPVAQHYGDPPIMTALTQDVTDGFVVCTGAHSLLKQAALCDAANKPFWLQLVGTGITTTWAAHLGAVCRQAKWPAITCMNIWESQLITRPLELRGGYYRVPEAPGLGIEIDLKALKKYRVDYSWVDPPRHLYRYSRASGEVTYYGCSKQALCQIYPRDAMPIAEAGSNLEVWEDDGTREFARVYEAVQDGHTLRRVEKGKKKDKKK